MVERSYPGPVSGPIQSVQRAAAVLELLGSVQEPLALGELARLLGLPKPTVHGLVRTLCDVGFVAQEGDTGYYVLDHRLGCWAALSTRTCCARGR